MSEKDQHIETQDQKQVTLEGGTYEILRNRLQKSGQELREQLDKLNVDRKEVFGSIETALKATERVTTQNNCIPWDMVPIGKLFIFGYNVHLGLKVETALSDVFSIYEYKDHAFHEKPLDLINNKSFVDDFQKLYKYYKNTHFVKFARMGPFLHMVFRIGKEVTDIKTFKWQIDGDKITYVDNRSDHEFKFPEQHEFRWKRTTRDNYRQGKYPHVSIEDMVFVETIGGDLTIKIEDNTENGLGIYNEDVEHRDQTLDDAEIYYTVIGNIIILKIKPYQEDYRYIVYNSKIQEARRIDAISESCILLPDDHGIIFTNGYYLQTGEFKQFENELNSMIFERRIAAPNGEDFLYIFYNRLLGVYLLLHYNLIEQKAENPTICHGYSIFENGEMILFRNDDEPKKHHAIQIWQTPYTSPDYQANTTSDSFLFKIGNKDIVRAMAECHEILTLLNKEDTYANLYVDLIKMSTDILDSYHWVAKKEAHSLSEPLQAIRETSTSAVDEFDKVTRIKQNTSQQVAEVSKKAEEIIATVKKTRAKHINDYVQFLAGLREVRGEIISAKELRYVDLPKLENYEKELEEFTQKTSQDCVRFLLKKEALAPYEEKVKEIEASIESVKKVVDANTIEENIDKVSSELEMLIDIVSNLNIEDATETTRIIDNISNIYSGFNQIRASLKRKRKELLSVEGKAEFNAQMKLIDQGVINYLDVCDTPEKCEEYLTKLMVQLEELEGKFSEFDEFIEKVGTKREEIYNAFESKKVSLVESRNKRANTLLQAANRILKAAQSRVARFESPTEINGYFASDMMIDKVRNIVEEMVEIGDSVKADDIQSRLKTVKEDAIRQLKDRSELFVDGENIIKFGNHQFTVNTQNLELTIVYRDQTMFYHLTGTNFFEEIKNDQFLSSKEVWDQSVVSENKFVYRSEYLAFKILEAAQNVEIHGHNGEELQTANVESLYQMTDEELKEYVQQFMAVRYNEGYVKGVHDHDALIILRALLNLIQTADLLKYPSVARAAAALYWKVFIDEEGKKTVNSQLKGAGVILSVFPSTKEFDNVISDLQDSIANFIDETKLFDPDVTREAGRYLFYEISRGDHFVIDKETAALHQEFNQFLKSKNAAKPFRDSIQSLKTNPVLAYEQTRNWLRAFIRESGQNEWDEYLDEAAVILYMDDFHQNKIVHVSLKAELEGLQGTHDIIAEQKYPLSYNNFMLKLNKYVHHSVPQFESFTALKKQLTEDFTEELRLNEFKPRILSSFVRNKLIDEVYLPLIGANLAKQIGAAGEGKRTDLMGLLLLISPPGYGKTTLMEYIANRLGVIFMKINGPALGHTVVSLDPSDAPNAAAREELEKLNLAFEMGDNVMIYLDDIQHCNPELLQKFISLCDAQRKIEGVYKGRSKTYDFRGKKVCVVMAGNPYTESGDKFRIPDMLANRADIYNLGDIIGDSANAFKLSYVENCLTSNTILAKLAGKSQKDVHTLIKVAETDSKEGMDLEANHSPEEINDYIAVLKKLLEVRDVILKVNQEYIYSAAQADEYRTEPPFKLQGSYRDMNKIAEKIIPIMNDKELETVILSHYESEAQTLTTGAEANLLKFKSMYERMTKEEENRWNDILEKFQEKQKAMGYGDGNQIGHVINQMESISKNLSGIREEMLVYNLKQKPVKKKQ
ncbi:MAG: DNA repair ATPase [Bacteroidota bacterium]